MQKNNFNINELPDVCQDIIKSINCTLNGIVENYKVLIKDGIKFIKFSIKNEISKPTIIFEIFFITELYLKLCLIKYGYLNLNQVGAFRHNIDRLVQKVNEINSDNDCEEVYHLLKKFRYRNGRRLNFNTCYDFKYNHGVGDENLLFEYNLSKEEIKNIEEVIEWIEDHIQII